MLPANVMTSLHDVGIPWLAVLPLSALLFRTALVYPWFIRNRRINLIRSTKTQPVVEAFVSQAVLRKAWARNFDHRARMTPRIGQRIKISWFRTKIASKVEKVFRTRTRPWLSKIIPLFILLVMSEAVRRLCGFKEGLLPTLLGPFFHGAKRFGHMVHATYDTYSRVVLFLGYYTSKMPAKYYIFNMPADEADQLYAEAKTYAGFTTEDSPLKKYGTSILMLDTDTSRETNEKQPYEWTQPTMKDAGFLWFRDLTQPDFTGILPLIFAMSLFATLAAPPIQSSRTKEQEQRNKESDRPTRAAAALSEPNVESAEPAIEVKPLTFGERIAKLTPLHKTIVYLSPIMVLPAMQMPVAMLIYFMSNMAISRLQMRHVINKYRILPWPRACRRAARMTTRTEAMLTPNPSHGEGTK